MADEWRDILNGAAEILEQRGWCTSSWEYKGAVCAMGALRVASGHKPRSIPQSDAFYDAANALRATIGTPYITKWNDQDHRKFEQVVSALRKAARRRSPALKQKLSAKP